MSALSGFALSSTVKITFSINKLLIHQHPYDPSTRRCFCCNSQDDVDKNLQLAQDRMDEIYSECKDSIELDAVKKQEEDMSRSYLASRNDFVTWLK